MRPPTDDPKTNVMYYGLLACTCATFLVIVMTPGPWKAVAAIPLALGLWIFTKILRRAKQVDPTWGP